MVICDHRVVYEKVIYNGMVTNDRIFVPSVLYMSFSCQPEPARASQNQQLWERLNQRLAQHRRLKSSGIASCDGCGQSLCERCAKCTVEERERFPDMDQLAQHRQQCLDSAFEATDQNQHIDMQTVSDRLCV